VQHLRHGHCIIKSIAGGELILKFEYVTQQVLQKMKEELHDYKFTKRPLVSKKVAAAREHGDLKENAEYHAAREELSLLETKIKQLEDRIGRARIIKEEEIPDDAVYILTTVVLKDLQRKEIIKYKLVSPAEANIAENKISVASPVGKALIGKKKGEKVTVEVPAGKLNYEIIDIRRS
jgi:transcription elongation factor GreA